MIFRKDKDGRLIPIANSIIQRFNDRIFTTTHSVEEGADYYDIDPPANKYITGLTDFTEFQLYINTPNETPTVKIRFNGEELTLNVEGATVIPLGGFNGRQAIFTLNDGFAHQVLPALVPAAVVEALVAAALENYEPGSGEEVDLSEVYTLLEGKYNFVRFSDGMGEFDIDKDCRYDAIYLDLQSFVNGTFPDGYWNGGFLIQTQTIGGDEYDVQTLFSPVEGKMYTREAFGYDEDADKLLWGEWKDHYGDYDNLSNKPAIPAKVSDLTNDTGYITGYTESDPIFTAWNKSTGISITKSQVSDLIVATQALSGLMSAADKTRLDVLHALLEEDTANNVVDSINEILAIFNNYPEGEYLVSVLAGKVDKVEGKGLSENDLTDTLKSNYDTAYTHSQSTHAPSNAQKNSDITKSEIEAKLTGTITSHSHALPAHTHDDRYYTETEVDTKLAGKQAALIAGDNINIVGNTISADYDDSNITDYVYTASGVLLDGLNPLNNVDLQNVIDTVHPDDTITMSNIKIGHNIRLRVTRPDKGYTEYGVATLIGFNEDETAIETIVKKFSGSILNSQSQFLAIGTIIQHPDYPNNIYVNTMAGHFNLSNFEAALTANVVRPLLTDLDVHDLNTIPYFNYAGSIYGAKYNLLASAWEHSLTVDPLEISATSDVVEQRGTAQYPNGQTEGVIIPHGVTSIGKDAFRSFPSNNQPLVIPNSVTSIGEGAFRSWNINNHPLVIPSSVTSIGKDAFNYWSENNHPIVIPSSVTSIGDSAFSNWPLVPYVEMQSTTPPTLVDSFAFYSQNDAPIYVPDASVTAYKTATNWVSLASRIFPMSYKDYTTAEKTKLAGIASGAEVNVQSDWNASSGDALILNKPAIPAKVSDLTNDTGYITGYTETDPIFTAWNKSTGISITKSQVSDLIEATQLLSGLMSATDKQRLDALHALLEEDTENSVVDSINEILAIFQNYPEGEYLVSVLANKVDKVTGKGLSTEDYTSAEKTKLTGIQTGAQVNTVTSVAGKTGAVALVADDIPNLNATKINAGTFDAARIPNLAPTKITQNASNRFVTDVEKAYWNGKQDKLVAGNNISINPTTNVISASGGGEVDLNAMPYFNYASNIYGAKYNLLLSAWEHSLTVDPLEISENSVQATPRGTAQYPNGQTEGVIIPHGVTGIGESAFHSWTSNNQPLVIPKSVTSIGNSAFRNWSGNNQPLVIPDSVTSIVSYAFEDWPSNNQPLVIPNSVTSIGIRAFRNWTSNTHPLVIPDSVTSIGQYAFANWSLVPYVEMKGTTPPSLTHSEVFDGQNNAPIYVPDASVTAYKTATNWVDLASRIFPMSYKDNIHAVGVVETRASVLTKIWTGTQAQYDAIGTKDANTLYFII